MFRWLSYLISFGLVAAVVVWFKMLYTDNPSLDIFSLGILVFTAVFLIYKYNRKTIYKKNYDKLQNKVIK
ncbi:hypothetical protein [Companilactobacillus hulinensis]|uniref:hypothetical protein n=1 Tax=Companilactobacillus hulinensis TaxID=2486007 RepID=UPI000F767D7B|nr:hypothetical protein [Companilactobacillus hulinensis]